MAEKPRLKKSDEIFGSITVEPARSSKRTGASSRSENAGRRNPGDSQPPEPQDVDFELEDSEDIELNDDPVLPSAQTLAQKLMARDDKRRKLNFEKYELPKHAPEPAPTAEFDLGISPSPAPKVTRAAPKAESPATPPAAPVPASFEKSADAAPVIAEYTFQSFDGQSGDSTVREFNMDADTPDQRPPRGGARRRAAQFAGEHETPEQAFELETPSRAQRQERPPAPRIIAPAPPVPDSYEPEPVQAAAPPARRRAGTVSAPPPPPKPATSEEDLSRQEFLKRIANQFELQFDEEFERGTINPRNAVKKPPEEQPHAMPSRAPFEEQRQQAPPPEPAQKQGAGSEDDFLAYVQRQERERLDAETGSRRASAFSANPGPKPATFDEEEAPALDFIAKFQQDIRKEEEERSEEFKEALSQKFMRERERYLKELGISEPNPEPAAPEKPAPAPPRRKLDFQIQPEMHMGENTVPPAPTRPATGPVTYTRGGAARPQDYGDSASEAQSGLPPALSATPQPRAQIPAAGTRKTAEQLLLEHTINARESVMQSPQPKPAKLNFTFSIPDERAKSAKKEKEPLLPEEKGPRLIVIISMVVGLFAIGLLAWPLVKYMQLTNHLSGESEAPVPGMNPVSEETLNVYSDLSYNETAHASNVMFKNANVTLKNVNVSDYVVIEGIDSPGKIRLEDVSVDSAVSVKECGIDTLELHNVKAGRVVINNPGKDMTISATGTTDVDVVELRTAATVRQLDVPDGAGGLHSLVIMPTSADELISTRLSGLNLTTLEATAENSEIAFENETRAETASIYGSLSLSGSGKVANLSIGSKAGQGAGDIIEGKDVRLLVKDVAITNLNIKSSADLNLSTFVDNVSTSDSILIGGSGSVGTLTLNPGPHSGRVLVDIAGLNIQNVYSNTPSRINVTGSAKVNFLTADASTYALGNKVNHLIANANDVIYENEPDNRTIAPGVNPPQSKAENPNIDYNLGTASTIVGSDGGDSVATCGHSRETGGFLRGDGSMDSPFEVATPLQLAHVSAHLDSYFMQVSELDMSSESSFSGGFPMIGSSSDPFTGVYNGGGFAISRLRIISNSDNVGLFAFNQGGTIQNVHVVSGEVSATSAGQGYVGAIAGLNSDGGSIRSCSNGAMVIGNQNTYTGGIAGYNFGGKVHDCYNYAKVSGVDMAGGIIGYNRNGAILTGSYNVGIVEARDYIGSVVGQNDGSTVANCYFLVDTAAEGIGSGSGTVTEKYTDEMQNPQMAADLAAGNENSLWIPADPLSNYSFPIHKKP